MDAAYQRLLWTGAAANGALLLALIGFAGSADDPMAGLRTITIPAAVGLTGFMFGGTAISYAIARLTQRPLEAIARTKIAMAHRQMGAFKDVLTTPALDPKFAELVWGDQADDQVRTLILGRLTAAKEATDKSPATFDEAMASLRVCADEGMALQQTAQKWLVASFVAAALGVAALVGQAWGTKPATPKAPVAAPAATAVLPKASPPASPVAAAPAPIQLPACPGGASDCQPWERAWKEAPPVGTVVPGRAEPAKR